MKTILISIILLLSLTLSLQSSDNITLTLSEKEYLKKSKTITYVSDPQWLPYEAYDIQDKHIGIIADMMKIFKKSINSQININVKTIKTNSWKETLKIANENKVDFLTSDPNDPALQKNFNHTSPYINNPIVIIMTNDNKYVSNLKKLKDKSIAITQRYGYVKEIKKAYPYINFTYVKSIDEGLIGVSEKKYDAFLASATAATYNISKNGLNNLSIVGSTKIDMKISFFVNKNNPVLLNIINKTIKHLKDEEKIKIMNKWSVVEFTQKIDYGIIIKIILVFLLVLLFVFIWNYKLKKSKNEISRLNKELKEKIDELEVLSTTDAMTQLYNRRFFDKIFSQELNRAKRKKHKLIFVMLDVDHFKQYNDTYGHDMGDNVLIKIAKTMQESTQRADEFAFRIGGEEFCIISSDINEEDTYKYIDKLRKDIEGLHILHSGNSASKYVTASFGLVVINCTNKKDLTTQNIYKTADNALYKAKESGRNNIETVLI